MLIALGGLDRAIQCDGLVGLVGQGVELVPQLAWCAAGFDIERLPLVLQGLHFRAQHVDVESEFGQLARALHQCGAAGARHVARETFELEHLGLNRVKACAQRRGQVLGFTATQLDRAGRLDRGLGLAGGQMGFGLADECHQRVLGRFALGVTRIALGVARVFGCCAGGVLGIALSCALCGVGAAGVNVVSVLGAYQQVLRQLRGDDVGFECAARFRILRVEGVDARDQLAAGELGCTAHEGALHQLFERTQGFGGALLNHGGDGGRIERGEALGECGMHQRVGDGLLRHQGKASSVGLALDGDHLALRILASFETRADLSAQGGESRKSVGGSGFQGIGLERVGLDGIRPQQVKGGVEFDQAREINRGLVHQRAEILRERGGARVEIGLAGERRDMLAREARQTPVFVGPGVGDGFPSVARSGLGGERFGGEQTQSGALAGEGNVSQARGIGTLDFGAQCRFFFSGRECRSGGGRGRYRFGDDGVVAQQFAQDVHDRRGGRGAARALEQGQKRREWWVQARLCSGLTV